MQPADGVVPVDFHELVIRDCTAGCDVAASLAVIDVAPGASHPRARSTRAQKIYLGLRGTVVFTLDLEGADFGIAAGDLLVIEPSEWFSYRNNYDELAQMVLVHVPPFTLDDEEFTT